jgi:hypothetical protein
MLSNPILGASEKWMFSASRSRLRKMSLSGASEVFVSVRSASKGWLYLLLAIVGEIGFARDAALALSLHSLSCVAWCAQLRFSKQIPLLWAR